MTDATASRTELPDAGVGMGAQEQGGNTRLTSRMGTPGLLLTVMAYLSPLSGAAGFVTP